MRTRMQIAVFFAFVSIVTAGCSMFVSSPGNTAKGKKVICVLMKETDFKTAVVQKLSVEMAPRGYQVIVDSNKRAKYYHARDYAAVVYMSELWAWHTPWHAKSYWRNNNRAENIIIMVTAGDPDVTISQPFDAITCPSRKNRIEPITRELIKRIGRILY